MPLSSRSDRRYALDSSSRGAIPSRRRGDAAERVESRRPAPGGNRRLYDETASSTEATDDSVDGGRTKTRPPRTTRPHVSSVIRRAGSDNESDEEHHSSRQHRHHHHRGRYPAADDLASIDEDGERHRPARKRETRRGSPTAVFYDTERQNLLGNSRKRYSSVRGDRDDVVYFEEKMRSVGGEAGRRRPSRTKQGYGASGDEGDDTTTQYNPYASQRHRGNDRDRNRYDRNKGDDYDFCYNKRHSSNIPYQGSDQRYDCPDRRRDYDDSRGGGYESRRPALDNLHRRSSRDYAEDGRDSRSGYGGKGGDRGDTTWPLEGNRKCGYNNYNDTRRYQDDDRGYYEERRRNRESPPLRYNQPRYDNYPADNRGRGATGGGGYRAADPYDRLAYERENRGGRGRDERTLEALANNLAFNASDAMLNPDGSLAIFVRNFYIAHPDIAAMTPELAQEIRERERIQVLEPRDVSLCPYPLVDFEVSSFPQPIVELLLKKFKKPTAIQMQGWPIACSGHNLIGIAETGSGKTLAFGLPALVHIAAQPPLEPGTGPVALVVAPTRELARQIADEMLPFARSMQQTVACIYGQMPNHSEVLGLFRRGVHFLVACPGKLMDFVDRRYVKLARVTYFVLDEADRMFEMGFEIQIHAINRYVRPDRQVLLWSATWPPEVRALANELIETSRRACSEQWQTIHIQIGRGGDRAVDTITQEFILCQHEDEKRAKFFRFMRENADVLSLVFCGSKRVADDLYSQLPSQTQDLVQPVRMHGDLSQSEREESLYLFRQKKRQCMVASELASRGLHIDNVAVVVNFDMPKDITAYIHQIGRTGRVGLKGRSVTFVLESELFPKATLIRKLSGLLQSNHQSVPSFFNNQQGSSEYFAESSTLARYRGNDMPLFDRRQLATYNQRDRPAAGVPPEESYSWTCMDAALPATTGVAQSPQQLAQTDDEWSLPQQGEAEKTQNAGPSKWDSDDE